MKIGPIDTEIALLKVKKRKKEEINVSKIYSPVGNLAERVKKEQIYSQLTNNNINRANCHIYLCVVECC